MIIIQFLQKYCYFIDEHFTFITNANVTVPLIIGLTGEAKVQGWKKGKISLEYGHNLCQKCDFLQIFRIFCLKKTDIFPLKIAKISLQTQMSRE